MKKDNKKRLFEVMGRLDKTFKLKLNETGEWSGDEDDVAWMEELRKAIELIATETGGKLKLIDIEGFDKYQGPYAIVEIDGKKYNIWTLEEYGEMWIEDFPYDNTSGEDKKAGFEGTIPEIVNVINNTGAAPRNQTYKGFSLNEDVNNKKIFILNLWGEDNEVYFNFNNYRNNGALAVELMDDEGPYATVSTNLPESADLPKDEFFLKNWSENEELAKQLIQKNIIIPTGKRASMGAMSFKVSPEYFSGDKSSPALNEAAEKKLNKKGFHTNIEKDTLANKNFRKMLYTGEHMQLVLMTLKPDEEIGMETHPDIDQFFRFEAGTGKAIINGNEYKVTDGDSIIIPAKSEHNIINTGKNELKMYTIYAPPHHKDGVIFKTKEEAEESKEKFDGKTTE
jgi:mannose-6-phosphate isomerase-like protein (cupin superfamily)